MSGQPCVLVSFLSNVYLSLAYYDPDRLHSMLTFWTNQIRSMLLLQIQTHTRNRYSNEFTPFWFGKFNLPFVPPALEWRCMSMAFPCRIINCFSWRFASRKMAKYVNIIIVHGIQNDIELDITAYTLFTSNSHTSGCVAIKSLCASVVYQPAKMGMNDNSAGDTHVFNIIIATTFFVMVMGYFNGFTIA